MNQNQGSSFNIDTTSYSSIQDSITAIAKCLITQKTLIVNSSKFSFMDIEFYFWHDLHPDNFAKGVHHDREIGELEMHRYGIDISLGNKNNSFGGILLRGLFDQTNNVVIEKSAIRKTLFNCLNIGNNSIHLIDSPQNWTEIFSSTRLNLGNGEDKYKNAKYRFLAKEKQLFKKYKGIEAMFKNSNLTQAEIKNLLGYNIK